VGFVTVFPITIVAGLIRKPEHPWQWAIRWSDFFIPMVWCLMLIPLLDLPAIGMRRRCPSAA
jgi:hypothetical protein